MPSTTTSTEKKPDAGPSAPLQDSGAGARNGGESELQSLKRSLQEQRRATTLLNAEVQRQIEAREAMEAQLLEANAEIASSWERRKEMTRVIGDRETKLAQASVEAEAAKASVAELEAKLAEAEKALVDGEAKLEAAQKTIAHREQRLASRDSKIAHLGGIVDRLKGNIETLNGRVTTLKAELQARYEELAEMQRYVARNSFSGWVRRASGPLRRIFR